MIPLLVASAFAVMPPPPLDVFPFGKPPDDVSFGPNSLDWVTIRSGRDTLSTEVVQRIQLADKARCSQQESLAVEHREGGFTSGFGPLPPDPLPPAPLTAAGFWSMGHARLGYGLGTGGFGKGGLGGFGRGSGGFGGGGTGGGRGSAGGGGGTRGGGR